MVGRLPQTVVGFAQLPQPDRRIRSEWESGPGGVAAYCRPETEPGNGLWTERKFGLGGMSAYYRPKFEPVDGL
ncbi:hypothetical protein WN55_06738 [Dufourea novaeangliae]|uniref:Uncharacterized protein n=1 Tax=Dufourea novaeangliae TaxID=178035 RepID=A0A154P2G0_DUFNO|nr:hypothetical protein WN55_06738 [Dufourea novaeangliae]